MNHGEYPWPIVEVIWDDAETDTGWDEVPKKLQEKYAMTVGFKIKETRKHLVVCSTHDKNMTNGRIQIPKGMVKSVKVLYDKTQDNIGSPRNPDVDGH